MLGNIERLEVEAIANTCQRMDAQSKDNAEEISVDESRPVLYKQEIQRRFREASTRLVRRDLLFGWIFLMKLTAVISLMLPQYSWLLIFVILICLAFQTPFKVWMMKWRKVFIRRWRWRRWTIHRWGRCSSSSKWNKSFNFFRWKCYWL